MRYSKSCPKCSSVDILCVPAQSSGSSAVGLSQWWPQMVWMTRYVCGACGFMELYVESPYDVAKIREKFTSGEGA